MDFSSFPPKEGLLKDVQDLSQPIAKRMRAIFYLKAYGGDDSVAALAAGEQGWRGRASKDGGACLTERRRWQGIGC